jgi:hypothetical protein
MKATLFGSLVLALLAPSVAAQTVELSGTWSGSWTPKGGVRDAVTVELRQDEKGNVSGRFLTPTRMDFTKASFDRKTGAVALEAADPSGKRYAIDAKVSGTEIKGTLGVNEQAGDLHLIKWTYFPR